MSGKIPFILQSFRDTPEALAIAERNALFDWQNDQYTKSISKYERIARQAGSNPQFTQLVRFKADLDSRTMDLRRFAYLGEGGVSKKGLKGLSADTYEKALIAKGKEYLDLGVLGPQGQQQAGATRQKWIGYRRELVRSELRDADSKSERQRAIRISEAFIQDQPQDPEIRILKESLARVYVAEKNYDPAVSLYRDLAQSAQPLPEKKRLLMLAIGAQSVEAQWPSQAPWDSSIASNDQLGESREKLKAIYGELGRLQPNDWFVAAQVGHLDIALGQGEKAFQDWHGMIAKAPRDYHAARAGGYMMTAYERVKSWEKLETLARLCLVHQVAGIYRQQKVDPHGKLGLALLELGKAFLSQKNYALAVAKLTEFRNMRPLPTRHDEGFYSLSLAQWGHKQYRESVQTTLDFVEAYPRSGYVRSALLNGGDWSGMLAFEENVMWFQTRFLERFPNDPEAKRVRDGLFDLTMGRELYGESLELLAQESKYLTSRGQASEASQVEAKMVNIEARFGSMDRAVSRAKRLATSDTSTDQVKAAAYGVMVQSALTKGEVQSVRSLVSDMENLADSQEKREAKAQALLFMAQVESKGAIKEYFNLELTNPLSTLNQRYTVFQKLKANYIKVCEVGPTAACAPALHNLARLSERFGASLEDINIQSTLAKPYVNQFKTNKQAIMNAIAKTTMEADEGAIATITKGSAESEAYTDPQWVDGVQWQNDGQWTVDKGQSLGSGFLQWSENRAGVAP